MVPALIAAAVLAFGAGCNGGGGDEDASEDTVAEDVSTADQDAAGEDLAQEDGLTDPDGDAVPDLPVDGDEGDAVEPRIAAEKFIPTFAVKYCAAAGARSLEETARFDVLITNPGMDDFWAEGENNSWQALKALNPDMAILLYKLGPGEYNTATWGELGEGWEWMMTNHGIGTDDRWIEIGITYGEYLQNSAYPNERLMLLGNDSWQRYWLETLYDDRWGGAKGFDCEGADGIFSDVTGFQVPYTGNWYREGIPDQPDQPASYWADGAYLHDAWHDDMVRFFNYALPWLEERGLRFAPNFGSMARNPENWAELDSMAHVPFAAMEEAGFVCPYGTLETAFKVWNWSDKVEVLSSLTTVKALMTEHGELDSDVEGLARMDVADPTGMTGWDALWFSMASFLMAFNDDIANGFMNFTIWGYCEYYWLDEFDPAYLHLGRARGGYFQDGDVYLREYDDGWVAANPSADDAQAVAVPGGQARVLDHDTFRKPDDVPLSATFDLASHRGVVLLKEGRAAGNEDN